MKAAESSPRHSGGLLPIEMLDAEISAAKAHLQELMAQKSRAAAAALPAEPAHDVPLYPWQEEALASWRAAHRRGVVQAVTGAGKTRVGIAAIAEALKAGRRAVVVVPTLVLVRQWLDDCDELLPGVPTSDALGDSKPWRILVTTIQTAMRRPAVPHGEKALLVVDEVHRAGAASFSLALRPEFDWRLGLTATLERNDEGDEILGGYFGGVVYDVGYGRALDDELISPFRFAQVSIPLMPHEQAEYERLTDGLRTARDRLVRFHGVPSEPVSLFLTTVSDLAQDRSAANPANRVARFYMKLFSDRRRLLAETPVKMAALSALSEAVNQSHGSIVFTQTKEASTEAAEVLREAGCASAAIHGELDKDSREERIDLFRQGSVTSLTAPRVLDEGVDLPDADLGIVTAANRSRRQMIQRLGRVLRRREGKTARFVVLYAAGTVEDPHALGHIPDFYDACLPFAEDERTFDLGVKGQLRELLQFLGVDGAEDAEWEAPGVESRADDTGTTETDEVTPSQPGQRQDLPAHSKTAPQRYDEDEDWLWESLGRTPISADLVAVYLKEIGRYPLLTAEQEPELAKQIEAGIYAGHLLGQGATRIPRRELEQLERIGREAFERMVCSNLRLVVSLAKRHTGCGLDLLDLIQEGNIGLMHAVRMFDFAKGNKFSTYATWWIRQALTRSLADQGATIRLPVHVHETRSMLQTFARERNLSLEELLREFPDGIAELGVTAAELHRIVRMSRPIISTEALAEAAEDAVVLHPVDGWSFGLGAVDALLQERADKQRCAALLAPLEHEDPRTAFVVKMRHGFVTGEPETLEVVGQRLGVSRERIRQIEKSGMEFLRDHAAGSRRPLAPPRKRKKERTRVVERRGKSKAADPARPKAPEPMARVETLAPTPRRADPRSTPWFEVSRPRRAAV